MNNIPIKLRKQLGADPFYGSCVRAVALGDHECQRDPLRPSKPVEWEHALTYAGKQVQKRFAIIPLCWWAHRGPGLNKHINIWIALNRASDEELLELSHKGGRDYFLLRANLNRRFGVYKVVEKIGTSTGINYGYHVDSEPVFHRNF